MGRMLAIATESWVPSSPTLTDMVGYLIILERGDGGSRIRS